MQGFAMKGRGAEERSQRREVPEHPQPHALTLFRVKLRGADVFMADRRSERRRVVGLGGNDRPVLRDDVIRVYEVDRGCLGKVAEDGRRLTELQLIPAHVRHLQSWDVAEANHVAREEVETAMLAILVAGGEEHLQAETNTEKRLARTHMFDQGRRQSAVAELSDGVAE